MKKEPRRDLVGPVAVYCVATAREGIEQVLETDRTIVISDATIRASDAERHHCTEVLSAHFVEGRLDQAELDERIGAAMVAKTRGELAALVADLPRPPRRPEGPRPRPRTCSRLPLLVAAGILFALAALTSIARQTAVHQTVLQNGPGTLVRVTTHTAPSPALPLLILAGVVLLVVCAVARRRSPRHLNR